MADNPKDRQQMIRIQKVAWLSLAAVSAVACILLSGCYTLQEISQARVGWFTKGVYREKVNGQYRYSAKCYNSYRVMPLDEGTIRWYDRPNRDHLPELVGPHADYEMVFMCK